MTVGPQVRLLSAAAAIREATEQLLETCPNSFVIGEGVNDPKHCFGTTAGLPANKCFEMPVSENGMTGVCIGAAVGGMRPIMVHMRNDFLMLAMDQIVNCAAKWYTMYGGKAGSCPITIRAIIGRGWGQSVQHSQNLEAMFSGVPGLKVVVPSDAYTAKGLLIAAHLDSNPVIMLEHRWVHNIESDVPKDPYVLEIGKCRRLRQGSDATIVSWGFMTVEAVRAADFLATQGYHCDVIDVLSLRPLDIETIHRSAIRTEQLIVVSDAPDLFIASKIAAQMPKRVRTVLMGPEPFGCPASPALSKGYYPTAKTISEYLVTNVSYPSSGIPDDVPDLTFRGPF